ncbi:uncharacterized protein VTP21DRAFT_11728 [Calcarisporiella thermophila]|uniref:uncharacterized protein n=1 Tax=Calcarisporiella thermophila TaxID=911321 RepID=UPI003743094A
MGLRLGRCGGLGAGLRMGRHTPMEAGPVRVVPRRHGEVGLPDKVSQQASPPPSSARSHCGLLRPPSSRSED